MFKEKWWCSFWCEERDGICGSTCVNEGILGKGQLWEEERMEGRCGGGWRWWVFLADCMHCGMTVVRSIGCVLSGFPKWLGAQAIECRSIIRSICVTLKCMYVYGCVYAQNVCCAEVWWTEYDLAQGKKSMNKKRKDELWYPWALRPVSGSGGAHNLWT